MSYSVVTPSPLASLRAYLVRAWDEPESRSNLVGMLGVLFAILLYILAILFPPPFLRYDTVPLADRPHATPRTFSIEMPPDLFTKPEPPPPLRFVETNPDAPDNVPDKTNNFSSQNQQVAQEKPTPNGKSETPALEGKKADEPITQIVNGRLIKPIEQIEAVQPQNVPPADSTVAPPKAEQNPLPGFEKKEGESKDGFGMNIAKILEENARPIPEKIEGAKKVQVAEGVTAIKPPAIDPKKPRDRPQVVKQQNVRPAILSENVYGTENIGPLAINAKWSAYGEYLRKMIDTIQIQWERILNESRTSPPSGSFVIVKFILNSDGRIAEIVDVGGQCTDQGSRACVSGITDRAPYGPWTDDMKAVLGEKQEMTFRFYYH